MIDTKEHPEVASLKQTIRVKGKPVNVDTLLINGQTFLLKGKFVRIAELRNFWAEDVPDPEALIRRLKNAPVRVDLLKFWQRLPDTERKFPYHLEWRYVAAIPITTHQHWFTKQISQSARNKIRKAAKQGVEIREEPLTDELIRGIMGIYNDSPVRRGKPFWHYGKDFDTVKKELSEDLDKCTFVTAHSDGELIGFIKFLFLDRYARTTLIMDKLSRRDKSPMNGLISKVIEMCAARNIPFFVYSIWRRGNHGQFQESNGFLKNSVPEYFVPLTLRGQLTLALKLHNRGLRGWIPEDTMVRLLNLRAKWYTRKYRAREFQVSK
jgi:hypothetical protein